MKRYMNCLWFALNRWAAEGGGLVFVRSLHWCMPHVLHRANDGRITHWLPPHDLAASWHSLWGYYGEVEDFKDLERPPIEPACMFFGSVVLVLMGGLWVATRPFIARPTP